MSTLSSQPPVSAMQRVPLEIIGEIASLAVASGVSPLTLSHVCRSWRATAIGTKILWSNIQIHQTTSVGTILRCLFYL
jgi:hypothetical protein